MGRPALAPPRDFPALYEQHGWEARDLLGWDTPRFKRTIDEVGGDDLKRRRRNYVLGRRLSSLKLVSKPV